MNKVFRTTVIVFGISLFMVNSSFGQSGDRQERKEPPTFKELLKEMDANEDGKLSAKEVARNRCPKPLLRQSFVGMRPILQQRGFHHCPEERARLMRGRRTLFLADTALSAASLGKASVAT